MSATKTVLVMGAEGTGKHEISKCLVENKLRSELDLDVLTCNSLPLPGDRDMQQCGIQFICFVMAQMSKDSLKALTSSVSQVDVSYFTGRSVVVVNNKDKLIDEGVTSEEIRRLADTYGLSVLHTNTENQDDLQELGQKLLSLIQTALSWKRHVTPALYESMRTTLKPAVPTIAQCETPATPAL